MGSSIATKNSWGNLKSFTPGHIGTVELNRKLNALQTSNLKRGVIPKQMEDKWFIYYDEPYMYFHRSWTGFLIFKIKMEPSDTEGETTLTQAEFTTDPEQFTGNKEEILYDINWLVEDLANRTDS